MASEEYEKVLHGLAAYGSGGFLGLWVVMPALMGIAVRLMVRRLANTGYAVPEAHQ